MRAPSGTSRLLRYLAMVVLAGTLVHPVLGMLVAVVALPSSPARRRARRRLAAERRLEGTVEVWDLRGVTVRMGAHELTLVGRHGPVSVSVHDLAGAETAEGRVYLVRQDGRRVQIGRSAADGDSLRVAVDALDGAIRRRTRGALEDRAALHQALAGSGLQQIAR